MKRLMTGVLMLMLVLMGTMFAAAADNGSVKGTVTWKYSPFVNNRAAGSGMSSGGINIRTFNDKNYAKPKGDAGAKIELISTSFNKNSLTDTQEQQWYSMDLAPVGQQVFVTRADNGGYYELTNIPAGEYLMIIVSAKERQNYSYAEPVLQKYIRTWDLFDTFVLSGNEYVKKNVVIKAGQSVTVNQNFDYTVRQGVNVSES